MPKLRKKLLDLISTQIEYLGYTLIGIDFIKDRISILRIYIDSKNGVNIDDCANVSYKISAIMERENLINIPYNLEISSPGLDRPLFTAEQYFKFLGKKVCLLLYVAIYNRRKWEGIIKSVNGDMITVNVEGYDKVFALNLIKKANLVPCFQNPD
ncbi:ribosome maturation factor RimP [Candidatus Pantoea edessiphila]|uniref:Ribosome maturation factor RimP n=1 Tax=Candidatus Pantoea edessiphila TaxID=2044610 RepID=A0A2P5SY81_9GAMM|nr:ribosome maturation factor RimP [Candidatus Pantoea edessiphila]MBK4775639.1 ribosome maturation factor RimP [Pantoea sp. Edef]PPI87285.1 ribosome maturation factor RimP [Candidatus Pantoea edessiphila]